MPGRPAGRRSGLEGVRAMAAAEKGPEPRVARFLQRF